MTRNYLTKSIYSLCAGAMALYATGCASFDRPQLSGSPMVSPGGKPAGAKVALTIPYGPAPRNNHTHTKGLVGVVNSNNSTNNVRTNGCWVVRHPYKTAVIGAGVVGLGVLAGCLLGGNGGNDNQDTITTTQNTDRPYNPPVNPPQIGISGGDGEGNTVSY